jgi:hypothetical protein
VKGRNSDEDIDVLFSLVDGEDIYGWESTPKIN